VCLLCCGKINCIKTPRNLQSCNFWWETRCIITSSINRSFWIYSLCGTLTNCACLDRSFMSYCSHHGLYIMRVHFNCIFFISTKCLWLSTCFMWLEKECVRIYVHMYLYIHRYIRINKYQVGLSTCICSIVYIYGTTCLYLQSSISTYKHIKSSNYLLCHQ
jgi:hypothetical protein